MTSAELRHVAEVLRSLNDRVDNLERRLRTVAAAPAKASDLRQFHPLVTAHGRTLNGPALAFCRPCHTMI
ncbi:hypothetical protein [Nonomuraea jiangxiensis]|uniref:Uncharacterized protein n=1 Tax=Nonomuraea jiangxiensis TaxID=633440 RepID=A0A1G9TUK3_9ACTN|nr:hypothetical protein [Nonomuraea jiangxiensis]SDM51084.1 hypothetical protein SAMN05421869_1465 [Nonomuraea jiangxiensis]